MTGNKADDPRKSVELDAQEALWARKRRNDLAESFSIVINVPAANWDGEGVWKYGIANSYTSSPPDGFFEEFEMEMTAIARESAMPLVEAGVLDIGYLGEIEPFPYSVGPAAQEWPKYLIELYLQARPFVSDGASLFAWGAVIIGIGKRLLKWEADKKATPHSSTTIQLDVDRKEARPVPKSVPVELNTVYSRNALIATCYHHAYSFYEARTPVKISVYCRGSEYSMPNHPSGFETYLIIFKAGSRKIAYLATGRGEVLEHFIEVDESVMLMPIPHLFRDQVPDYSTFFEPYVVVIE